MTSDRIWNVSMNLDAVAADMDAYPTDAEQAAYFRGFRIGARGLLKRPGQTDAWTAGYILGSEAYQQAATRREKQSQKGVASAAARASARARQTNQNSTTVEPRLESTSTTVEPQIEPRFNLNHEPLTNIEGSKNEGSKNDASATEAAPGDGLFDAPAPAPRQPSKQVITPKDLYTTCRGMIDAFGKDDGEARIAAALAIHPAAVIQAALSDHWVLHHKPVPAADIVALVDQRIAAGRLASLPATAPRLPLGRLMRTP